jgi:predicted flap endonuclease-1-like 5' DNA nuclease
MIALAWQTLLILTVAYFLGCIVGCLARKLVGAGPVVSAEPILEAAVPAPVAPPPLREVARVVAAPVTEAAAPAARPVPGVATTKAFRRADLDTPDDTAPAELPFEPEPPRRASPKVSDVPPPATVAAPISAAAAVATAVAERMAVPTPPVAALEMPEPVEAEPAAAEPVAPLESVDDLTRIRAIDAELASKLNELGVTRYAEIAGWTSEDVHTASDLLGFDGRIERENWIEQAQILARGGATSYATGLASAALRAAAPAAATPPPPPERGPEVATRAAFAEPRPASPPAAAPPVKVSDRDDLQRIGGITGEIESALNSHEIARYSQIAGWTADDVQRVEALLGSSGRISRENWIEQAQILARGGATAYSRTFDARGGPPPPMTIMPVAAAPVGLEAPPRVVTAAPAPPPPEPEPEPVVAASASEELAAALAAPERTPDLSGMRSVRSEAFRAPDSMAGAPTDTPDDLKHIRGIGLLIERKLNAMGVSTYEQIANWTADDVGTANAKLEFKGRIERENWIEQARILASGGKTDFSRRFERGEV